jgi:hypothetical protein
MKGAELPETDAEKTPTNPSKTEFKPSRITDHQWNLRDLEFGTGDEGEKASSAEQALPYKDETTYPEGGLQAWLVVLGSFCAVMTSIGTASSFGSFQSYFITHQLASYSPGVVGWIFSSYIFLAFAGGVVAGPIFVSKYFLLLLD